MLVKNYTEYYTVEDYQHWQDDWELIYGSPYAMAPSPMVTHQNINMKIARQLSEKLDNCPKCQALFEIDWEISSDTVVKPDTLVICYEPDEKLTKKPELIFEIISSSTVRRDETLKYELYQQEGVEFYVIVYPKKQVAKVYKLKDGRYIKASDFSDEMYEFDMNKCKIDFDFSKIWRVR
ncbi:Uma2 family endonuclease [bacterium]|nr:Uma2 family endonuclease [bacterium]MBU1958728.1 Uma2 family endonuclease [bacterium]